MVVTSHFLEIAYRDGTGLSVGPVFTKVVSLLHDHSAGRVALAFPDSHPADKSNIERPRPPTLGKRLLVLGDPGTLATVVTALAKVQDYVIVSPPRMARATAQQCTYRRVRDAVSTSATLGRILRRARKRAEVAGRALDENDARYAYRRSFPVQFTRFDGTILDVSSEDLPYVMVASRSTGKQYPLHFTRTLVADIREGEVDSYGFSLSGTTVPDLS